MTALIGAIDIGASKTLVAVRALPVLAWSRPYRTMSMLTPQDPGDCVERVSTELSRLAAEERGELLAIGCGAPGPLDRESGVVIHSPNQSWHDVPFGPLLMARLGLPVGIDDDARLGALGEAALGAGVGEDPVVYLTISTGIGSGVVVGGELLHGGHDLAGEVGHLVVDVRGPRCSCGNRGCIEAFASGGGIERRARAIWRRKRDEAGRAAPRSADDVFRVARSGDPHARVLVEDAERALSVGLASLAATVDPGVVVVGGSLGLAQRAFLRRATALARRRCLRESGRGLRVVPASLGNESVLAGAALLAAALAVKVSRPGTKPSSVSHS